MKKSRIIVPALALLCLSTAATISGSVAWFTANRTFNTTVGNFQVARLDGNLKCDMGTLANNGTDDAYGVELDENVISVTGNLLNASYDHINEELFYSADGGETLVKVTNANEAGTAYTAGEEWLHATYGNPEVNYYYAVSWKMTFTFEYTIDLTQQDLFFDNAASAVTLVTNQRDPALANNQKEAIKGFRIAFLNETQGDVQKLVWADNQDEANCQFIKEDGVVVTPGEDEEPDVMGDGAVSYTNNGKLLAANTAANTIVNKTDAAAASDNTKVNYVGTFAAPQTANTPVSLTITAVAWFEGTDPNIVDGTYMDNVTAKMSFFVHQHKAA